jgi:hypothetical protein
MIDEKEAEITSVLHFGMGTMGWREKERGNIVNIHPLARGSKQPR